MKKAFTLAEVLITLVIVGVVAALTIPSLLAKINLIVSKNSQEVIEDRFLEGLNTYNTMEQGLSEHYSSTKQFLDGLSKYYKMAKICDIGEIQNCYPYSQIVDEDVTLQLKNIAEPKDLGLMTSKYLTPAAFISANGTPFIVSLKKGCIVDSDKPMKSITDSGCIALLYDENGARKPNAISKDIIEIGGMNIKGYYMKVNGVKIAEKAFDSGSVAITKSECQAEILKGEEYGDNKITACYYPTDAWAGAMKYCKENGYHLATREELSDIIEGFFSNAQGEHPTIGIKDEKHLYGYTLDKNLAERVGLTIRNGYYNMWSSYELEKAYSGRKAFNTTSTVYRDIYTNRSNSYNAICVIN